MNDLLKGRLTKRQLSLLPSSYDIVGSILIFSDFPKELVKKEKIVGEALLKLHKNIKTVCKKTKKYSGKYRLPKLNIIAGEKTKETIYKENKVVLKLNVEKVYFSSRLGNERKRIYKQVKKGENILVMFSGCGPFPCVTAKNTKAKKIVGVEINPAAHKYGLENVKLNRISNVRLFKGDVRKIVPKLNKFDRVLMPLPKGAEKYLDLTLNVVKKGGFVHFYTFASADEIKLIKQKIRDFYKKHNKKIKVLRTVKCGQFSPYVFRFCVDYRII